MRHAGLRRRVALWIAASVLALVGSAPAHAIFLEADRIDADGSFSTVDLWFFSFDADATATIQVNDLHNVPGADPDMIVYMDDGTFTNVFALDTAAGSDPAINALFPAGAYVAAVGNHPLPVGEFGPFRSDLVLASGGYEYEFNGPTPTGGEISIDCILSGNLEGGYTKRVLNQDTCRLPPGAVPEPAGVGLLGVALIALGLTLRRRFMRQPLASA